MYDLEKIKKQLARSKKINANQQETIKQMLDSNRQMINKGKR